VVLSCVGCVVISETQSKVMANWMINLSGILLLLLLAEALEWYQQSHVAEPSGSFHLPNKVAI
jgi:hypothetical protein